MWIAPPLKNGCPQKDREEEVRGSTLEGKGRRIVERTKKNKAKKIQGIGGEAAVEGLAEVEDGKESRKRRGEGREAATNPSRSKGPEAPKIAVS